MVAGHIQFSTEELLCITKPRKLARKLFHLHSRRLTKHSLALPRVLFCIKQKGDPPKGSPFVLSGNYSMTATAPASFMRATIFSASSLLTPSLIMPRSSTSFFASARPREVNSRTALMTSIFFAPISLSLTLNSVFSSSGEAAAAAGAAPTATGAAALTPNSSYKAFTSSLSSTTVIPLISSMNLAISAIFVILRIIF